MSRPKSVQIRDYLFRETVSCPLKLSFILQEGFDERRDDLFRRKTKRMLREAVAQLFGSVQYTSDGTDKASRQTERWLRGENAIICGAVITHANIRARIPILIKNGNELTIVQVHGKLAKGNPGSIFQGFPLGKSLNRYLLMAAYRKHVLSKLFPDIPIRCKFIFPLKSYHSETDHLFQKTVGVRNIEPAALEELSKLFAEVDGTSSVQKVMEQIPSDISHSSFNGLSVAKAIEKIREINVVGGSKYVDNVHSACKDCNYRRAVQAGEKGCWDIHFPDSKIINTDRHQFDLIGHHVKDEDLQEGMYQERIVQPGGLDSSEKVIGHTDQKIAIYHRKAMQLLEAKDKSLPLVFAKKLLYKLNNIEYPIHFLDFEAASHCVPLQRGKRAYDPVLFQFSCHSLLSDGTLKHTQWLDQNPDSRIHYELTAALSKIPGFGSGTIVQYSPFERQALNKLYNEMRQDKPGNKKEIEILEKMLRARSDDSGRFLDLSVILREGYYNCYMNNGLSLKQILLSVLKTESILGSLDFSSVRVGDMNIELFKKDDSGRIIDPYHQISDERSRIQDGITAMHAYLCMKAGSLSEEQFERVPVLLKRYCTLDTLALYIIFSHLMNLTKNNETDSDIVIEG